MTTSWLALLDTPAGELSAEMSGLDLVLTAWPDATRRPHPYARRVAPDLLDASGTPAHVSLLWPDRNRLPLFDDPAVVHARRAARRLPAPRAVSTLTVDSRHFAGSLWVADEAASLGEDPFRLLGFPMPVLVAGGLIGRMAPLCGPAQERYAGAPWPAGGF